MLKNASFALILLFLIPGLALAQAKVLTLDEATRIALERNIDVIQTQNNIDAAKGQVLAAWGGYLPSLSASGSWSRTQSQRTGTSVQIIEGIPVTSQTESFGVDNSFNTGLSSNLTLFDGLARESNLSAAKARNVVVENTAVRTRQAVVYSVTAGFLNVIRTRELVTVAEENLKRDQRQLERITESNRVGALSLADVYRQQSQVANDELDVINAQNNYEKAKADLIALIGLSASEEVDFRDPSLRAQLDSAAVEETMTRYADASQLAKAALSSRPDYIAAGKNLEAAQSSVTSASAGYWPSLSAFGSYGNFSNEMDQLALNRNYTLNWGLSLRWNLFDRFLTNQSIQSAKVGSRNAEVNLVQAEKDISVEVKKALLDLEAARKSWEVSLKVLRSATEDRKIAEERYNLGAGTLLDLLVANATYVGAQATQINAITGFLIAKYNVEFVLAERGY
jgi:outer membrane protein